MSFCELLNMQQDCMVDMVVCWLLNIIILLVVLYSLHDNWWLPASNLPTWAHMKSLTTPRISLFTLIWFPFWSHIQIATCIACIGSSEGNRANSGGNRIISCQIEIQYRCLLCALQRDVWMQDLYFHGKWTLHNMRCYLPRMLCIMHQSKSLIKRATIRILQYTFMFIGRSLLGTVIKFHDVGQIITLCGFMDFSC